VLSVGRAKVGESMVKRTESLKMLKVHIAGVELALAGIRKEDIFLMLDALIGPKIL
jgi:hypothetical protein